MSQRSRGRPRVARCLDCSFRIATLTSEVEWAVDEAAGYVADQMRRHSFACPARRALDGQRPRWQWVDEARLDRS
jgi:hypothetical protein